MRWIHRHVTQLSYRTMSSVSPSMCQAIPPSLARQTFAQDWALPNASYGTEWGWFSRWPHIRYTRRLQTSLCTTFHTTRERTCFVFILKWSSLKKKNYNIATITATVEAFLLFFKILVTLEPVCIQACLTFYFWRIVEYFYWNKIYF